MVVGITPGPGLSVVDLKSVSAGLIGKVRIIDICLSVFNDLRPGMRRHTASSGRNLSADHVAFISQQLGHTIERTGHNIAVAFVMIESVVGEPVDTGRFITGHL